jgi:hypothetical protein
MACIFLFLIPRLDSFFEKIQILFLNPISVYFILHLKTWFKFEYWNQFSKVLDLTSLQKVYFKFS